MIPIKRRPGWRYLEVAELIRDGVLEIGDGYRAKNSEMGTVGLPFARAGNVNNGFHFDDADILSEQSVKLAGEKLSRPGDITFTSKGTFGRFAIVRNDTPPFVYSPQLCYWRVKQASLVDRQFLYYWMQGSDCMNQLNVVKGLTDMADYVSLTNQRKMWLSAPPLPIQQRIAGILSAYDELIENNQRRIKILEEMARSLYREWFVHFRFPGHEKAKMVPSSLGPIPQGWEVKKLVDLTGFLSRGISPKYDDDGDSIVINQKCIREQHLSLEPARRQIKPISEDKRVRFGDVLINSTGVGTLGRVAQVYEHLEQCTVDTHVTIVRPNNDTDIDFFGCALFLKQQDFERLGIGATGQTELSRTAIGEVKIPTPPNSLQKVFGGFAHPIRTAAKTLSRQVENLRRTRDLLLPRLLSGQLDLKSMDAIA